MQQTMKLQDIPPKSSSSSKKVFQFLPWKSKDYFFNGFSLKTIVLVRVYYQQILGNVIFMVFDFQGLSFWPLCFADPGGDFNTEATDPWGRLWPYGFTDPFRFHANFCQVNCYR